MWPAYRRLFERPGVALFLFPPMLGTLVEQANKARGRVSASSQRNCAARVNHVALALCLAQVRILASIPVRHLPASDALFTNECL